jgi:hypothetical protein
VRSYWPARIPPNPTIVHPRRQSRDERLAANCGSRFRTAVDCSEENIVVKQGRSKFSVAAGCAASNRRVSIPALVVELC